jgi:hypothetical protein
MKLLFRTNYTDISRNTRTTDRCVGYSINIKDRYGRKLQQNQCEHDGGHVIHSVANITEEKSWVFNKISNYGSHCMLSAELGNYLMKT